MARVTNIEKLIDIAWNLTNDNKKLKERLIETTPVFDSLSKLIPHIIAVLSLESIINKYFANLCAEYGTDNVLVNGSGIYVYLNQEPRYGIRFTTAEGAGELITGLVYNDKCFHLISIGYADSKKIAEDDLFKEIAFIRENANVIFVISDACPSEVGSCDTTVDDTILDDLIDANPPELVRV